RTDCSSTSVRRTTAAQAASAGPTELIEYSSCTQHAWRVRHACWVFAIAVVASTVLTAAADESQSPAAALSYRAALSRALSANPRIIAARLRRPIGIASRDVAAERLNPEVRVEASKETPKEGYTLAVPLELSGKRARRIAVADAAIKSGEAELNVAIAEVQADVRRAFIARVIAENRLALLSDMQTLARRARDAAQARFDAGGVPRLEVVQAQLALADAENQATAARGTVDATRATLNAVLAFPLDAPTPVETSLDIEPALSVETVVARARQSSAELLAIDRRIDEQRARLALAHALRTPDVTPEAALTRRAEP